MLIVWNHWCKTHENYLVKYVLYRTLQVCKSKLNNFEHQSFQFFSQSKKNYLLMNNIYVYIDNLKKFNECVHISKKTRLMLKDNRWMSQITEFVLITLTFLFKNQTSGTVTCFYERLNTKYVVLKINYLYNNLKLNPVRYSKIILFLKKQQTLWQSFNL